MAASTDAQAQQRLGLLYGFLAYLQWGVFPLYWPLMKPAVPGEILAHRIVWSLAVVAPLLVQRGELSKLRELSARRWGLALVAAVCIGINWMTYIWAVNSAHVVESALGYFINPLVTVLLGVAVLGERLRRAQWAALGFSAAAVAVVALDYGHLPWVALTLAFSFAFYGLAKKRAGVGPLPSLAIETGVLTPLALLYLASLGGGTLFTGSTSHRLLLASTGVVTTVPLLCFGAAANRIPLSAMGILQYVSPTLQFICGVAIQHEPMPPSLWVGFGLVWVGLVIFAADGIRALRRPAVTAPALA